jgi:hypothetical protein
MHLRSSLPDSPLPRRQRCFGPLDPTVPIGLFAVVFVPMPLRCPSLIAPCDTRREVGLLSLILPFVWSFLFQKKLLLPTLHWVNASSRAGRALTIHMVPGAVVIAVEQCLLCWESGCALVGLPSFLTRLLCCKWWAGPRNVHDSGTCLRLPLLDRTIYALCRLPFARSRVCQAAYSQLLRLARSRSPLTSPLPSWASSTLRIAIGLVSINPYANQNPTAVLLKDFRFRATLPGSPMPDQSISLLISQSRTCSIVTDQG